MTGDRFAMMHLYPGMGATNAMYTGVWRELPDSRFHDWPEWTGEASIKALATRLIGLHEIKKGDVVMGTSLGGMVACEIANQIALSRLVLIGSARSPQEINGLLRVLQPLVDTVPFEVLQFSAGKIPKELSMMFHQSDPRFVRSMCKAVLNWEGLTCEVKTTRIHGNRDFIIPEPRSGVDWTIDGGGHLIVMSHAGACMEVIRKALYSE